MVTDFATSIFRFCNSAFVSLTSAVAAETAFRFSRHSGVSSRARSDDAPACARTTDDEAVGVGAVGRDDGKLAWTRLPDIRRLLVVDLVGKTIEQLLQSRKRKGLDGSRERNIT